jgi:hypothetical protein
VLIVALEIIYLYKYKGIPFPITVVARMLGSTKECMCAFILFVSSCVKVGVPLLADLPSKESYRLYRIKEL